VLVAILGACASAGSERPARVERTAATDPWALRGSEDAPGSSCTPGGRRCPKGRVVPTCTSRPAPSELSSIDRGLVEKVGQRVTVVARPNGMGVICTLLGCDCCNRCSGDALLCGKVKIRNEGGRVAADLALVESCDYAISIGSCDGNESLTCCSIQLEDRPLVARGVLRQRTEQMVLDEDGNPIESNQAPAETGTFELEHAEYCYLQGD